MSYVNIRECPTSSINRGKGFKTVLVGGDYPIEEDMG